MKFLNRADAGRQLASRLTEYAGRSDVLVLALPRGGVPVAFEVARHLHAPLDVFFVRKLGVPGQRELAMGALAAGGVQVLDTYLIKDLGISQRAIDEVAARERLELERQERVFHAGPPPVLRDRTVIVVDDGLATGATMKAAVLAILEQHPAEIVAAAPVGARDTCRALARIADRVVCVAVPEPFSAVAIWYEDFAQTSDDEVRRLLREAGRTPLPKKSNSSSAADLAAFVRERAVRLDGEPSQYDALLEDIGDARIVLLGEATHGTHEFYRERAFITRRLIVEKGFTAVAVEADWPDAYRVNRYVRGTSADGDAAESLSGFGRFPTWMWRNADVLDFIGWLREYNDRRRPAPRVGFYGLDLYSLRSSIQAVLQYLDRVDPGAAHVARQRYACFDRFGDDIQRYAYATGFGRGRSCEQEVVTQLVELHRRRVEYASRDGRIAPDDYFFAEQNARLVQNAEAYYRTMLHGRVESWNLRDRHMGETLGALSSFLDQTTPGARVVVWAHNSHLGDARATEMGEAGELNLGQLVRQTHGARAVLVGFTTYDGTVTAAAEWDGPALRRHVRPALAGSYEELFHRARVPRFLLPLRTDLDLASALATARLERAIGVLYLPEQERRSHYFRAKLPEQFDCVLHFDHTRAVEPLERAAQWEAGEVAETYPSGL